VNDHHSSDFTLHPFVERAEMAPTAQESFPCALTIDMPFPTYRLASATLRTLSVDEELSPLVRRHFSLLSPPNASTTNSSASDQSQTRPASTAPSNDSTGTVLRTQYSARTNRMLRVAVNGFFESIRVVLQVMEELDVDVVHEKGIEGLERVQGVEQGMTGSTIDGDR